MRSTARLKYAIFPWGSVMMIPWQTAPTIILELSTFYSLFIVYGPRNGNEPAAASGKFRPTAPLYAYAYGAVSPVDGRFDSLILQQVNSECMQVFYTSGQLPRIVGYGAS